MAIYTALNPWLRSQSGIGEFGTAFEPADIVSTARDSNVFNGVGDGCISIGRTARLRWQS
ncbi:hypothetical protein [Rhizobium yanglingense]